MIPIMFTNLQLFGERERVHSTYAAMGGGGVWPLRTRLYLGGGGVWPLRMYAFYRPNFLIFL